MRLGLVSGAPPKLEGRVWLGGAPVSRAQLDVTFAPGRWVTIGWHVNLGPRVIDRHATLHVEGASAMINITDTLPSGLTPVGAQALGRAAYVNSGPPPGLVIDNFCVARGPIAAMDSCPIGAALPPPADAGTPPLDASTDSSAPADSSTPPDGGSDAGIDSGDEVDSGGEAEAPGAVFRGAGGCACDVGGRPPSGSRWAIALVLLASLARRRRTG